MGLRGRLRKLERDAEEEMIVIPQHDGTVRSIPQSAGMDAYMNLMDRLGAGDDAPREHPMIEAIRNSSDPEWTGSFYFCNAPHEWIEPVKDLSE